VDKDFYQKEIAEKCFNLGDVLLTAAGDSLDPTSCSYTHWNIPFERIISATSHLRPRYYSICSSPRLFPNSVHVAAVVVKERPYAISKLVYGLTTNYLLNLKRAVEHEDVIRDPKHPIYSLEGPRNKYRIADTFSMPVHLRQSNFRLPSSVRLPVIMIGPGTVSIVPSCNSFRTKYCLIGSRTISSLRSGTGYTRQKGKEESRSRRTQGLGSNGPFLWLSSLRFRLPLQR
jgi:hypothetical protein